jgi:TolB-like protein/tetratricopeptide (TPR) repeat protein
MDPVKFFAELKRRNVYKVAVAYTVVAWLLIQVATQVFPFFEIPNWVVRLVVLLTIIGFPVALVIAWAFELTPEGLQRTEVADRRPGQPSGKRRWIYVAVSAGVLSAGLFFLGRYTAPKPSRASDMAAKSIAVLPFENLSRDPDTAYFAEGIQEEILTRLAKIADLKVISRTSTQRYKSSPDDLPAIARQLGVANILQGSVQRSADAVRVNVQLINAETDAHLWADTFDRKLTDIFKIESEIAKTIAETLRAKLTGAELTAIASRPTESPEAHQLYLEGRFSWNKRTGADLKKAIDYFKQAIEQDPEYALAYAGLADSYVLLSGFGVATPHDSFPLAKAAAKKALEIDETLGEAHTSLAVVLADYEFDLARSTSEFERAIELNPNYATAHQWFAEQLETTGQFDRAIAEMKRALELDPLSLIINADLGSALTTARRYDEAIVQLRKTIEMDPRFYYAYWNLAQALELKGAVPEAITKYQKTIELDDDPLPLALLGHLYAKIGKREEARKILERLHLLANERYVAAYTFALIHLGLGEKDEALHWLEESYGERDGYSIAYIRVDPMLDPIRGDPRFEKLVATVFASGSGQVETRK